MAAVMPPAEMVCPQHPPGPERRRRCYLADVTSTGVQVWAYHCEACGHWWLVRFHPSQPDARLICDQRKAKPKQTHLAMCRQAEMEGLRPDQ